MDGDTVLENIIFARAFNSEHQMDLIIELTARVDFSGRGELSERQQKLNVFLSRLIKISEEYNLAVFITNQMSSDPGATMTFTSDPKKPVGGHILAHASTTRLNLRKGRGEERIAKIYDSPDMPESEATGGIIDCLD